MTRDQGMAGSPPAQQTGMSLESLLQQATSTTGQASYSMNQPSSARSSVSGQNRQILPTRPPRSKTGHERKRSKLSTDVTPFDSVDYWIQFDNEEGLANIPESTDAPNPEPQTKSTQLPVHR